MKDTVSCVIIVFFFSNISEWYNKRNIGKRKKVKSET
jgi:hypothetical protein